MFKNKEYDIWDDDNPAAKALRENLPWHLTADELAKQSGLEPPPAPADTAAPAAPSLTTSNADTQLYKVIDQMADMMENNFHKDQEIRRINRHFEERATVPAIPAVSTPTNASAASNTDSASLEYWQKTMQKQFNADGLPVSQQPMTRVQPVVTPAPTQTATPAASTFPYKDMGELTKPASDKIIKDYVQPAAQKFVQAVKDKEPVNLFPETVTGENWTPIRERPNVVATPEADLLNTSKPVSDAVLNTYTKDNVVKGMNAIHAADTRSHESDMTNPNSDLVKGMEYTTRDFKVSERATQQVFNRIFSPDGVKTKELDEYMKKEEAWLENNPQPELRDFWKIDWQKNPDKVLELGGKYFRQSLVGNHAYGLALSMIDSGGKKGNPILNQQVEGTMTGIARIYCNKDEILQAAIAYGKEKPAEGWDFMVQKATGKLPLASSEGILFLNRFLTQEQKETFFHMMTKDVIQTDIRRDDLPRTIIEDRELPVLKKIMPRQMK